MFKLKSYFDDKNDKSNDKKPIAAYIFFGIMLLLAFVLISVVWWSDNYFGVGLEQIIFTMTAPMKGANSGVVVRDAFCACLPIISPPCIIYALLVFIDIKFGSKIKLRRVLRRVISSICVATLILSVIYANNIYNVVDYVKIKNDTTTIYEDYYIDPNLVSITSDGNTKNLICIYLESMENSYSSVNEGGFQKKNLIPNLTELANSNISFSNSQNLGGFYTVSGTSWTMGAVFSLNSGIPYSFSVKNKLKKQDTKLTNGVITLGDILNQKGYVGEFLCGSDVDFGGRRGFFNSHGYEVFDYYSAIKEGYIDDDYHEFWGLEDQKLYEIAKDELNKLASSGKPFNFSMLTVDTHFPGGYECELCESQYKEKAANVVSCADRQINDFIDWCKQQEFYEETVIVVLGDHPRMERVLVPEDFEDKPRTMYNCIINSAQTTNDKNFKNRTFTAMDYFPTILSSMGFNIEGDRLGLGTNLLSEKPTLPEELGLDYFNNELSKYSAFYIKKIG